MVKTLIPEKLIAMARTRRVRHGEHAVPGGAGVFRCGLVTTGGGWQGTWTQ